MRAPGHVGAGRKDLRSVPVLSARAKWDFLRTIAGVVDDTGFRLKRYGEIVRFSRLCFPKGLRAVPNSAIEGWNGDFVMLLSPRLVREFYTLPTGQVDHESANKSLLFTMGSGSPFVIGGREHAQTRRPIVAEFSATNGDRYRELSVEVLDRMIDELPLGEPVSLQDFYQRLTQEIILRVTFGFEPGRELEEYKAALYEAAAYYLPNTGQRLPGFALTSMVALRRKKTAGRALAGREDMVPKWLSPEGYRIRRTTDALLYRKIAELRECPNDSVASRLIQYGAAQDPPWTDKKLRDVLATILIAGHDTSAMAYSWATEYLMHNPEPRAKLVAEALEAQTDRYAQAANLEATRLRAPVWGPGRIVAEDISLGGYRIRKNSWIFVMTTPVHYDEVLYPEPAAYRPERFLESPPDHYGLIAFSAGVHRCPGTAFYLMEASLVMHRMFGRLELTPELSSLDRTYFAFGFFNRPKHGTRATVVSRRPAAEIPWYRPTSGSTSSIEAALRADAVGAPEPATACPYATNHARIS